MTPQPPDWADLAKRMAEQDREPFTALVVTNSLLVINSVVMPTMIKQLPKGSVINYAAHTITLPNKSKIWFRAIATEIGLDGLRGMQFDLVFFDPAWEGSIDWREQIWAQNRKSYAARHA